MEDLNIAIRLKGFIDYVGLTHSQFADKCGIPRPSLSQILSGRNKKVSDVIVGAIHKTFPEMSVVWLMFGEGPMITPSPSEPNDEDVAPNLFGDGTLFADNDADEKKYGNLKPLNTPQESSKVYENKINELNLQIANLQTQIEKIRQNPRKVTQITVYYDDSTFETFYPK